MEFVGFEDTTAIYEKRSSRSPTRSSLPHALATGPIPPDRKGPGGLRDGDCTDSMQEIEHVREDFMLGTADWRNGLRACLGLRPGVESHRHLIAEVW